MTASPLSPESAHVARLQARVEALEAALERRSRELLLIAQHACKRDLTLIARVHAGLPIPALASCDAELWNETTETTIADVEEALQALWRSLPAAPVDGDGRP
jgi:hypothetical protein